VRRRTDSGAEGYEEEYKPPISKKSVSSTDPDEPKPTVHDLQEGRGRQEATSHRTVLHRLGRQEAARTTQKLMKQIRPRSGTWTPRATGPPAYQSSASHLTLQGGVRRALETGCDGVGAGTVQDLHGKPKALDAYYRKLKLDGAGIRKAYIGVGSGRSQRGRERAGRPCRAFRRYHRRWVPKSVTWRDGVCTVVPGHLACHAKTIDENLTTQCCWRCGKRTLRSTSGRAR
jgi:hypothetical protein